MELNNMVYTGRKLNGHDLMMQFLPARIGEKVILKIVVPIPENYISQLTKYLDKHYVDALAKLQITLNWVDENASYFKDRKPRLFINAFYVYPQLYKEHSNRNEKEATKGIGKFILCSAIEYAVKNFDLLSNEVFLEASGGKCDEKEIDRGLTKKDIIYELYEKYTLSLKEIIDERISGNEKMSLKDLQHLICAIRNNQNLVKYYKTYGFKSFIPYEGTSVSMVSTIEKIFDSCKKIK